MGVDSCAVVSVLTVMCSQYEVGEAGCTVFRQAGKYLCAGDASGKVRLLQVLLLTSHNHLHGLVVNAERERERDGGREEEIEGERGGEREVRERASMCERERERERACVCACVCVCEREGESMCVCV